MNRSRSPESAALVDRLFSLAASAGPGVCVLPAVSVIGRPVEAAWPQALLAQAIVAVFLLAGSLTERSRLSDIVSIILMAIAAFGLAQASNPGTALILAPTLGIAAGLVWSRTDLGQRAALLAPAGMAAAIILLELAFSRGVAAIGAAAAFSVSAAAGSIVRSDSQPGSLRAAAIPAGSLLLALVSIAVVGATTPRAAWFGPLVSHGPRDAPMVAITFDDGPNAPYTLEMLEILDRYGVKATFFSVGKAVAARPDVSAALLADGQLLGNHAYNHNGLGYLDPRYPELARAATELKNAAGICPAFFRPPHGTHTPFMSRAANKRGMRVITWDVSAGDWQTNDAALVASRVLESAKPGSIILLHDGLDGVIGADRSVVVEALPAIIEGLRARGLEPVTLDKLLGQPGYVSDC